MTGETLETSIGPELGLEIGKSSGGESSALDGEHRQPQLIQPSSLGDEHYAPSCCGKGDAEH